MISELSKEYLIRNSANCADELFAFLINRAIGDASSENITLVDYGGGTGMLSMQAKRMGIKTVIYCDMEKQMYDDAQEIASGLGLEADHYVCGDIDKLVSYCRENNLVVNAVCSHDVLEHIADLEHFAHRLRDLPHDRMTCCLSSGANLYNPIILFRTLKMHRSVKKSYRNIQGPYRSTWLNPRHPITGYWQERLMTLSYLEKVFSSKGFSVTFEPGLYTRSNWRKIINLLIQVIGYVAAPYYVTFLEVEGGQVGQRYAGSDYILDVS